MSLPYSIREGLAGFRRAKFAVLASTAAMTVALVLIGLFALVGYQGQQVSDWLRQRVGEVEIMLAEQASEAEAASLQQRADVMPGVEETEYISQEDAQNIFAQDFGEGAEAFFDEPFLPASIKVRVRSSYANPDSLNRLSEEFETWNRVDEVIFNQPLLVKVQRNLRLISVLGFSLGTLVVLASLFLVANTIRLTIYARRLLIRTMKLVGATDDFIRRPFIVEGIAQGVVAGVLACLVLWGLYRLAAGYLQLPSSMSLWGLLFGAGLILTGILLGWLGSYFAVRRFIKDVALH